MIDGGGTVPTAQTLDLRNPLIWPLVPTARRDAVSVLWAVDAHWAAGAASTREAALYQIRQRWWAERLEAMARGERAPDEPLLQAVAERCWPESTLLSLAELADAHGEGAGSAEVDSQRRPGEILFGLTQAMIEPAVSAVVAATRAGGAWSCVRAALPREAGEARDALFAAAAHDPVERGLHRSLAALTGMARVIAKAGGRRRPLAEQLCILRIGLFGR